MKSAAALILALALLPGGPAPGARAGDQDPAFVDGIEDLPLMPGLRERAERTLVFDTPQGRIVEAFASGTVAPGAVLDFYAETLPQLGWRRDGEALFRRAGEVLALEFSASPKDGTGVQVRFSLSPAGTRPP